MNLLTFLSEQYQWQLALYVLAGVLSIVFVGKQLIILVPAFKRTQLLNKHTAGERQKRNSYLEVQKRSMFYGFLTYGLIFALVIPFCITSEPQSAWTILLDIFVILMFYDFFYYLTHRFVFHDGPLGGPLIHIHAVHHRQKDPCRMDSSYLHPLEAFIGLALFAGTVAVLTLLMGKFHVVTLIVTWVAFTEINLHNHDLMKESRFPFRYLNHVAAMHHVHHSRFTSGNFATITLFYDWLFGTYDTGNGYKDTKKGFKEVAE